MKKLFFLLAFLFFSARVEATTLGDAAAALAPGQWVKMLDGTGAGQMGNLNATASYPAWDNNTSDNPGVNGSAAPGPAYDGGQPGWNSATRKMYFQTTEHGRASGSAPNWCPAYWPLYPHGCWKPTWVYDTDTNLWNIGRSGQIITGPFPQDNSGNPQAGVHVWGGIAWDDGNQVLYVKQQETFTIRVLRFCAPTSPAPYCAGQLGTWKALPDYNGFPNGELLGQALSYHRTINGGTLLVFSPSGSTGGCAAIAGYKEGTTGSNGVWTLMDNGAGCKFPNPNSTLLEGQYSTIKQVTVFSTGGTAMWRITNTGVAQALDSAPCAIGTTNGNFATAAEDANTGDIYFLACDASPQLWKLNPTGSPGSQWTLIASTATLTSTGNLCAGDATNCIYRTYATPIRTYGVIGFWRFVGLGSAEYWLFKPSASGGDIVAPTVSMTAPAAGTVSGTITVSATASDNVGVAGVQFKVDGVNLLAEDTTAPYSISWNTATASNASHTLTATARDAAGNSTTSTGVVVTVANAAAGSDFTTRCAASGVLRCIPFDSSIEIACTLFGCVDGIDTAGDTVPVIDTSVKASGIGSLKFTIPANSTQNSSGTYWANFSANLSQRFGASTTFYIQWRQRFSPELINTIYWKDVGGDGTLTFSDRTAGAGRTATLSGSSYSFTGKVGRNLYVDRFNALSGLATITAVTSPTVATVTINNTFASAVNTSGNWYNNFENAGGWKMASITTGDKAPCSTSNITGCFSSCTALDVPVQNTEQRKYVQMYHSCTGSSSRPGVAYEGWNEHYDSPTPGDLKLQNARTTPYCLYTQTIAGTQFPPTGNCFGYFANEWMTFKVKFTVGPRGSGNTPGASPNDEFVNSNVKLWVAREGQASELVIDWYGANPGGAGGNGGGYPLSAGTIATDEQYGKMYLLPYHSFKSKYQTNPVAFTWYDELIISTQDIADPSGAVPADTTNPTVAITSPVPPTTSSTTSPITVSGTAADNVSVTSVTWTCIQCVTKGGTATSSPGASISWLIPALDLTAGTNTLNVVAHDAAGNVSSAATLTIAYAPSSTYWVSKLGNDSNGCTSSNAPLTTTAKLTITAGLTCLSAGNTLFIRAGSYNERLTNVTSNIPGGSSWATATTISGYPLEVVEIKPTSIAGTNILDLRRPSQLSGQVNEWIIWQDLIFDGTNVVGGFANIITVGQSHNRFSRVTLRNQGAAGTDHQVSAAMSIGGDDISGPVIGTEFTHGFVHDNSLIVGVDNGTDAGYGFYDSYTTATIIENSDIYRNGAYGIHGYHASGHHQSATYRFNRLWDNQMYGINGESAHILASSGNNHRVYGNVMWSTGTNVGPQSNLLNGIIISTTSGTVIANNTVYNMPRTGITTYDASTTSATVENNIIVNSNQNNAGFVNLGDPGVGTTKASNLCFGSLGGTTNCNYTTDPLFVNPTGVPPNFRIGASSQANNTGVNLGSTFSPDIAGVARPGSGAWDLGAYEFVATFQPVVTIVNPTANATLGVSQPLFSLGGTSNLP